MKTVDEIMESPYQSLLRMKDSMIEEVLQFGPFLFAREPFENSRKELSYTKNPILKYLLDMAALGRMEANETATFKEKKEFLLQLMKETSFFITSGKTQYDDWDYTAWCALRANQYAESALHKLRNLQYKDACVESAMTGYAPIVPYGIPMMKLPLLNKKSKDLEEEIDYKLKTREALEMFTEVSITNMNTSELREKVIRLLIDYAPVILSHTEYTIDPKGLQLPEDTSGSASFPLPEWTTRLLSGETEISASDFYAMAYCILSFAYYTGVSLSIPLDCSNLNALIQKAKEIADGMIPTFESLLEMSDLFSTPESSDDIFPTPSKLSKKFEDDKEKEDSANAVDKRNEAEQEKEFDADILIGYIYTHRRFKQDNYTNQAFLAQYEDIKDYSYMQDNIMICTVKEKYLCSPAIDLAGVNNYQLVLICLDKNDQVFVVKSPDDLV